MKKLFIYSLFVFFFAIVFTPSASADTIPPDSHSLDKCVKVVNLNEYPEISLLGYYTGPMVDGHKIYQIENNKCLKKGYKFNDLSIYWNTEDKVDAIDSDKLLLKDVDPYGGNLDNSNPLVKKDVEYSIAGFDNGDLVLYKSKVISEYNDGSEKIVETFKNPLQTDSPAESRDETEEDDDSIVTTEDRQKEAPTQEEAGTSKPTKISFWQRISCFLKGLFGISCY